MIEPKCTCTCMVTKLMVVFYDFPLYTKCETRRSGFPEWWILVISCSFSVQKHYTFLPKEGPYYCEMVNDVRNPDCRSCDLYVLNYFVYRLFCWWYRCLFDIFRPWTSPSLPDSSQSRTRVQTEAMYSWQRFQSWSRYLIDQYGLRHVLDQEDNVVVNNKSRLITPENVSLCLRQLL